MEDSRVVIRGYNIVKIFTATTYDKRKNLGDVVTAWIRKNPDVEIVNTVVLQSSDHAYHCSSIVVFGKS